MLSLNSPLASGRLPNTMHTRSLTNRAGRATPTAASIRKLGLGLYSQQHVLNHRVHTATQTSAQLRESNESIAAAAIAGQEDLLQATADALDPERTSASLGYTWLTHWQLIEEDRRFRQLVFQSIRGRQQQRQQQLFDILGVEGANSIDDTSNFRDDEVRIVHGRLSVVSGAEESVSGSSYSTSASTSAAEQQGGMLNSNLEEEGVDDLTWLASHPEATEFPLDFDTENEATTAIATSTSGSSSGGGIKTPWPTAAAVFPNTDTNTATSTSMRSITQDIESLEAESAAAVLPGAVQLHLGADVATVRPLWISIYLEESTGTAKLFESVVPLQPEILDKMSSDLTPFCSVTGLDFGALADLRYGPWLNYFVGLVGDVAVEEADILWPNQVLHRDRVLYNVRGADDVAKFLADPRKEDVEAHAENLKRLAEERGYRRGWVWYMLRSRWGEKVLKTMGIDATKT